MDYFTCQANKSNFCRLYSQFYPKVLNEEAFLQQEFSRKTSNKRIDTWNKWNTYAVEGWRSEFLCGWSVWKSHFESLRQFICKKLCHNFNHRTVLTAEAVFTWLVRAPLVRCCWNVINYVGFHAANLAAIWVLTNVALPDYMFVRFLR